MKVTCNNCRAEYKIRDDKIQSSVFTFRCPECKAVALVDVVKAGHMAPVKMGVDRLRSLEDSFLDSFEGSRRSAENPRLFVYVRPPDNVLEEEGAEYHWSVAVDGSPWFVATDGVTFGPMTAGDISRGYRVGRFDDDSRIWKTGMPQWAPLRNCRGLLGLVATLERVRLDAKEAVVEELKPTESWIWKIRNNALVPRVLRKGRPAVSEVETAQDQQSQISQEQDTESLREVTAEKADEKMVTAFEEMQEIFSTKTHDEAAAFALSLARRIIPCDAGNCMLREPGGNQMYVAASEGPIAKTAVGKKRSHTKGMIGLAVQEGVAVNVANTSADSRFDSAIDNKDGYNARNLIIAPVQYLGQTIGALELLNAHDSEGFHQDETNVLAYLAQALGEFIEVSLPDRLPFREEEFKEEEA